MTRPRAYGTVTAESLTARLGAPVHLFDTVPSTQDIAHEMAQAGAPSGTVVLADAQAAGRGRMGRAWASEPGQGVWCTVLEREVDPEATEVLSLRVGLEIANRLDAIAGEAVRLKWPNDLYLATGKVGGVLAEARWAGSSVSWIAIGVGINVVPPRDVAGAVGLPPGVNRLDVLAAVVHAVRDAASREGTLSAEELNQFQARDILTGRKISAPEAGVVRGVASSGALVVETRSGVRQVRTGTVHIVEGGA